MRSKLLSLAARLFMADRHPHWGKLTTFITQTCIMRIICCLLIVLFLVAFTTPDESLQNTRWSSMGFMFHFTATDTVHILMDDEKLADAIYTVNDSILTWRDVAMSEMTCDTAITGSYIYTVKDDVISFRELKDDCKDRAASLERMRLNRDK